MDNRFNQNSGFDSDSDDIEGFLARGHWLFRYLRYVPPLFILGIVVKLYPIVLHFLLIIDNDFLEYFSLFLFHLLLTMVLICFYQTAFSDPNGKSTTATTMNSSTTEYFCDLCNKTPPEGGFHCPICKKCVRKYILHCSLINNCVGWSNEKHFLLFLIYSWLLTVFCCLVDIFAVEFVLIERIAYLILGIAFLSAISVFKYQAIKRIITINPIYLKAKKKSLKSKICCVMGDNILLWFFPINNLKESRSMKEID
ncbi:zinc finger dhhc domain containing protein [Anaeramoeba flamelloides]|uniref:Palmitoyltransferase n=1 Tax=Anaeramoeba flamelloides TaxID=1746091 RepID=A0AAV7ZCK2_9EUKA|nr:zinc finger dhhc domain containing protein [Anaeramoeba flamelloides]